MENKSKNEMIRYNTLAAQRVNQKKTTFSGNLTGWIWLGRMYWKKCREIIMTKTEQKKKGERKKRKMKWNKIKSIKRAESIKLYILMFCRYMMVHLIYIPLLPPPKTKDVCAELFVFRLRHSTRRSTENFTFTLSSQSKCDLGHFAVRPLHSKTFKDTIRSRWMTPTIIYIFIISVALSCFFLSFFLFFMYILHWSRRAVIRC